MGRDLALKLSDKSGKQSSDEEEPATILKKAPKNTKPKISTRKSSSSSDSTDECPLIHSGSKNSQSNNLQEKYSFAKQDCDLASKLSEKTYSISHQSCDEDNIILIDHVVKKDELKNHKTKISTTELSSSSDECSIIVPASSNSQSNRPQSAKNINPSSIMLKEIDQNPIILIDSSSGDESNEDDFCIIPIPKTTSSNLNDIEVIDNFKLKPQISSTKFESKAKCSKDIDNVYSKSQTTSDTFESKTKFNLNKNSENDKLKPQNNFKTFDSNDVLTTLSSGSYEVILVVDTCETSHA